MSETIGVDTIRQLFAEMPIAAVLAEFSQSRWVIVFANPAYEALTGFALEEWREDELLGPVVDLPAGQGEGDLSRLRSAMGQGIAARGEFTLKHKNGGLRHVEAVTSPIFAGDDEQRRLILLLTDSTERRNGWQSLAEQRDRLLDHVAHAPLGILALDWVISGVLIIDANHADPPVIYVNAAFERMTGYAGEEVIGRSHDFILAGAGNEAVREQVCQALRDRRAIQTELSSQRKDGSRFWGDLSISPVFDERTDTTHFLCILNDITDRKQKEEQLRRLSEELRNSRDNLLSILDKFPSGTLILAADGTVVFCSAICEAILGVRVDKLPGRHWRKALPLDADSLAAIHDSIHAPETARKPLTLTWRDAAHEAHWVECSIEDDPLDAARRLIFLDDVTELHRLRDRLESIRFSGLLGDGEAMRDMNRMIGEVARGNWTVLIEGETGVGKELVAHAIHEASPRRDGPFIAVNSAGLSESLLASQLFGHRKGAFTGATSDQPGFFEAANRGTLFLDEIGDLPLPMQASLLRVLQEQEIIRLGETRPRPVDVRIIAATHRDLVTESRVGRFREDLLFRLRVARIHVPPLRARKTDIPLLVTDFLQKAARMAGKANLKLQPEVMQFLLDYDWPGNVRELRASIDYAVIHSQGDQVRSTDLPPEVRQARVEAVTHHAPAGPEFEPDADDSIRIQAALKKTRGNRSRAAMLLGMSRSTFYRRLREMGMGEGD